MKKFIIIYLGLVFYVGCAKDSFSQNDRIICNDSLIQVAVDLVNEDSVRSHIQGMQDRGTRFLIAENRREVANWIMERFKSYGITDVELDSFQCYTSFNHSGLSIDTTTLQYNVIAKIEGAIYPDHSIVFTAHYDCMVNSDTTYLYAPGADDNASGVAALFESARIIMEMDYQPQTTLTFIAFGAEELMYFGDSGSEHYAPQAAANDDQIDFVINNDMIAYDGGGWEVSIFHDFNSQHVVDMLVYLAGEYSTLNLDIPGPLTTVGADLQPFLDEGYSGAYFMERDFSPYYHSVNDVVDSCNIPYCVEVIKINVASAIYGDITVGIDKLTTSSFEFEIFPNPIESQFSVVSSKLSGENCKIELLNAAGKNMIILIEGKAAKDVFEFDVGELPCGVYIIRVQAGNRIGTRKLIISD